MASYFNLTLDTTAPSGVSVLINGDETKTSSTAVTLTIACGDTDTTGYQMKIWGTADAETEDSATWESFAETKNVTLPTDDGVKTVYIKVRDDVWNESATASDTISLYTSVPTVENLSVGTSKISLVSGKSVSSGSFYASEAFDAVKIMLVDNVNAKYNDSTNISIPVTNGSSIENDSGKIKLSDCLEFEDASYDSDTFAWIYFSINAADINAVSPGDGVKIIKAFVRSAESGNWSI